MGGPHPVSEGPPDLGRRRVRAHTEHDEGVHHSIVASTDPDAAPRGPVAGLSPSHCEAAEPAHQSWHPGPKAAVDGWTCNYVHMQLGRVLPLLNAKLYQNGCGRSAGALASTCGRPTTALRSTTAPARRAEVGTGAGPPTPEHRRQYCGITRPESMSRR
jgi:hypothetical protein